MDGGRHSQLVRKDLNCDHSDLLSLLMAHVDVITCLAVNGSRSQ
jgi:hypothetical protein